MSAVDPNKMAILVRCTEVGRLKIAVDNASRVEKLQRLQHLVREVLNRDQIHRDFVPPKDFCAVPQVLEHDVNVQRPIHKRFACSIRVRLLM